MARKESITQEAILEAAFMMAREEGIEAVTARKLAARAGCSTQPIFRVYRNMEELMAQLYEKAIAVFHESYQSYPKNDITPFVDLGMAYILFAQEEKHLFRMLFMSQQEAKKSMYELLNAESGAVVAQINKAESAGCGNPQELFMKMWIFIHGAASMTLTGDYDLNEQETRDLLRGAYRAFSIAQ